MNGECRIANSERRGAPIHYSEFAIRHSPFEAESLEQLGWLELGFSIAVVRVEHAFVGIDTPDEYAAFVKRKMKDDG